MAERDGTRKARLARKAEGMMVLPPTSPIIPTRAGDVSPQTLGSDLGAVHDAVSCAFSQPDVDRQDVDVLALMDEFKAVCRENGNQRIVTGMLALWSLLVEMARCHEKAHGRVVPYRATPVPMSRFYGARGNLL